MRLRRFFTVELTITRSGRWIWNINSRFGRWLFNNLYVLKIDYKYDEENKHGK